MYPNMAIAEGISIDLGRLFNVGPWDTSGSKRRWSAWLIRHTKRMQFSCITQSTHGMLPFRRLQVTMQPLPDQACLPHSC